MRINEKKETIGQAVAITIFYVVVLVICVWINQANIPLISWLAQMVGYFAILGVVVGVGMFLWRVIANAFHGTATAIALNTLPDVCSAILPAPQGLFDPPKFPTVDQPAPVMSDKMWDYLANEKAMQTHIAYLDEVKKEISKIIKEPPLKYNVDRRILEEQQIALYRMAHQSAAVVKRIEAAFPNLKADLTTVPQASVITLPKAPENKALGGYEGYMKGMARSGGHSIGRAVVQGNPVAAAVTVAAIAAVGVVAFQKSVRAMYQAHGDLEIFIDRAKNDLRLLGVAHAELVMLSGRLFDECTRLHQLLQWARAAEEEGRFKRGKELSEPERRNIQALAGYAVIGRLDAGTNI